MKPVVEYLDYRKYMRDFYEERKQTSVFSWREFSSLAGYSSPVFLKLVCDGKNGLPKKKIPVVGAAMGLAGYELEYFSNLVLFNQARTDSVRKKSFEQMRILASRHKVNVLGKDLYDYFSSWINPVVRELAPTIPGAKPSEIARQCMQEVSANQVEAALSFLIEAGMLKLNSDGSYSMSEKSISTGPMEVSSLAVRNFHREMGNLALDSIEKVPTSERNFSALTLGLTRSAYEQILDELAEFRRKVVSIATNDSGMNRVYQMNFQLFPLTLAKDDDEEL